jgi:hypothetical protein
MCFTFGPITKLIFMQPYTFIHDAPFEQLERWWCGVDTLPQDFGEDGIDEVAYGLTKHVPAGVDLLRGSLYSDSIPHRKAALYFLSSPTHDSGDLRKAIDEAFATGDRDLVTTAFLCYEGLNYFPLDDGVIASILAGSEDRLVARAMVYQTLAQPDDALEILTTALSSSNPRCREYACDEIGDRRLGELRDLMRPLLQDSHQDVVASARANLEMFE